jgi:signal peptidase II
VLKKYLQDYFLLFLIAGLIVVLDQLTKSWVRTHLAITEIYLPDLWLTKYARILFWRNTGAAFGIFQNFGGVISVLSFIVSGVILYYFPQIPRKDWIIRVAMGLLLGGAIGNLIDRLTIGYVTDFISLGNFPVFNIADASISTGVAVLFIGMWVQERRKKAEDEQADTEETDPSQSSETTGVPEEMRGD